MGEWGRVQGGAVGGLDFDHDGSGKGWSVTWIGLTAAEIEYPLSPPPPALFTRLINFETKIGMAGLRFQPPSPQ